MLLCGSGSLDFNTKADHAPQWTASCAYLGRDARNEPFSM